MSQHHNNKFHNPILSMLRSIRIALRRMSQGVMRSLLRSWMALNRHDRYGRAGFVLPTVTMVLLVVVLLTITIMLRSMDRAKMAQYRRVDEQVLQAATPAIDRAKAKITRLLQERYEGGTPSDEELYIALRRPDATGADFFYRLPDEERLTVKYNNKTIENAWRFPVDTNNDGKFDSYSLYGIYFTAAEGNEERSALNARSGPMPPIASLTNATCSRFIAASSGVESNLWPRVGANLKKAFFVYTTTVPITAEDIANQNFIKNPQNQLVFNSNQYQNFTGTPAYSALEYQRDENRVPLTNNAVVYEDDLIITPGPAFRLNGRIVTNSNLVATPVDVNTATLYLISGKNSCYYEEENSKIVVGGNVINGTPEGTNKADVGVHLYKGKSADPDGSPKISTTNQSISNAASVGIYNSQKQATLLNNLVNQQIANAAGTDPKSVQEAIAGGKTRQAALETYFKERIRKIPYGDTNNLNNPLNTSSSGDNLRANDIWNLPVNNAGNSTSGVSLNLTQLQATDFATQSEQGVETYLGDRVVVGNNLPAQYYKDSKWWGKNDELPIDGGTTKWTNDNTKARTRKTRVQPLPDVATIGRDGYWEEAAASPPKRRFDAIGGLRAITGAGVYERADSFLPPPTWDNPDTAVKENSPTYDDPATTRVEEFPIVWPDTMPMSPSPGLNPYDNVAKSWVTTGLPVDASSNLDLSASTYNPTSTLDPSSRKYAKGDLRMRATAVYHYASDFYDAKANDKTQLPIACVSSYFDPTDQKTAKNMSAFPAAADTLYDGGFGIGADGKSNNGVVYPRPTTARPTSAATLTDGWKITLSSNTTLANQANLVFPDGRFVNEPLRKALMTAPANYTLADQAAIDSALCSLDILSGAIKPAATPDLPHGAIREAAFLNPREVKAIEADNTSTRVDETFTLSSPLTGAQKANLSSSYNLSLEERMPLEIRVTQLDLNLLRNATIAQGVAVGPKNDSNQEYMLPYSGIIYASRNDALMDLSYRDEGDATNGVDLNASRRISPTDFKLDPTRRPNGIMLINGKYIARNDSPPNGPGDGHNDKGTPTTEDVLQEKGLTLVSNLGVYIQGDFNLHSQQEFTETFTDFWNFNNYYKNRVTVNTNFGCKKGDPRLCPGGAGDTWRPANVLSDAITLLSDNFRLGFRNEGDFDLRNNSGNLVVDKTGYDLDGNGLIDSTITKNEADLSIDLNGNGVATDTVPETQVTTTAARQLNGFFNNNFVTNGLSSRSFDKNGNLINFSVASPPTPLLDSNYLTNNDADALNSSYFTNFVTPIQRRQSMPEYVMEICRKLPVSACQPDDWVVGIDSGSDSKFTDATGERRPANNIPVGTTVSQLLSGTTARPALDPNDRRYPRRIAFLRYQDGSTPSVTLGTGTTGVINTPTKNVLVLHRSSATTPFRPVPLGISGSDNPTTQTAWAAGTVQYYPYAALNIASANYAAFSSTNQPRLVANSLWYRTTSNFSNPSTTTTGEWTYTATNPLYYQKPLNADAVQQPLLVPVLQIHATNTAAPNPFSSPGLADATKWIVPARSTTFNLVMATGDTPSRPGESNGGLQNLPRFLENWRNPQQTTTISGSFIQLIKSNFNTPSQQSALEASLPTSIFGYNNKYSARAASGRTPYFVAPEREWGFDVALLSQPPDLLAQKFTGPAEVAPDEFYQEVSRSEPWVQGLLCSRKTQGGQPAVSRNSTTPSKTIDGTDCTSYGG